MPCGMLLVAACARWPEVLFKAFDVLDGFEPRAECAVGWYGYLVRLLRVADGNSWKPMFDEISQGRNRCYTGLLWLCKILGVVECSLDPPMSSNVVKLGASQKMYLLSQTKSRAVSA